MDIETEAFEENREGLGRRLDPRAFSDSGITYSEPDLTPALTSSSRVSLAEDELEAMISQLRAEFAEKLDDQDRRSSAEIHTLNSKLGILAERFSEVFKAQASKIKTLSNDLKMAQRAEERMTQLIEKHNQIINECELKLSRMQNVIDEQELKLTNTTTYLKEALNKLERLKRL